MAGTAKGKKRGRSCEYGMATFFGYKRQMGSGIPGSQSRGDIIPDPAKPIPTKLLYGESRASLRFTTLFRWLSEIGSKAYKEGKTPVLRVVGDAKREACLVLPCCDWWWDEKEEALRPK